MEVMLDGHTINDQVPGDCLQDILVSLSENHLGQDRILQEVSINGEPYDVGKMGPATAIMRGSISKLEIVTLHARDAAMAFLSQAQIFIAPMLAAIEQIGEMFRTADERQASEEYIRLIESMQLLMQMISHSRDALGLDFDAVGEGGVSAAQRLETMSSLMDEMIEAQEGEDWVLLADLLEYDIKEELEHWQTLCARFADGV